MNPLRLQGTNLRCYPSLDWRIPDGISAIIGPNGAGKSTLLDGIELGLFADGARDLAPVMGSFDGSLELILTFEHQGGLYRIRRTYVAAGRGRATLDFEQRYAVAGGPDYEYEHGWEPLTRESASATQELICATIGLSRSLFNASAFLAQGNAGAWLKASPAEKKALLGEMLDFAKMWPGFAAKATAARKQVEGELARAQGQMEDRAELAGQCSYLVDALTGAKAIHGDARRALEDSDGALERALASLAANEAAVERLRAATQARLEAENRRDNARDTYRAAREQAEQLPHAQAALTNLAAISTQVPELARKAEAQSKALAGRGLAHEQKQAATAAANQAAQTYAREAAACDKLRAEFDETVARYLHLEVSEGDERCDRCQQLLGEEARLAAIANLKARAQALNDRLALEVRVVGETEAQAERLSAQAATILIPEVDQADYSIPLAQARKAGEERAALEVKIQSYEQAAAELPALKAALEQAEAQLTERAAVSARVAAEQQDSPALAQAADDARGAKKAARASLDAAQADLVRAQEALARAEQAATELAALREQTADANWRFDLLKLAERACGRDGIPALIAENTCGVIEAEANRVLERLPTASGTTFRVELRTQRPLKGDASALRETLDILVSDRQQQREYLTFSGGEQWRVSFALRWALARLLAGRRGAESRLLVIDEPDGLDAGGMDGLAAVLREEQGGFEKILLVSHSPLLATAFEQVVEVESDGEVSRLITPRIDEVLV